jgi:hypothetical protein
MQDTSHHVRCAAAIALIGGVLGGACASSAHKPDAPQAQPARAEKVVEPERWTDHFAGERVLTAVEISIEGPRGLLAHLFTTQDAEHHTQTVKTTSDGLRIDTLVKGASQTTDGEDYVPIRAKLDQWTLVADRRLVVLENPFAKSVVIQARGDVFLSADGAGRESRGNDLRVVGELRP